VPGSLERLSVDRIITSRISRDGRDQRGRFAWCTRSLSRVASGMPVAGRPGNRARCHLAESRGSVRPRVNPRRDDTIDGHVRGEPGTAPRRHRHNSRSPSRAAQLSAAAGRGPGSNASARVSQEMISSLDTHVSPTAFATHHGIFGCDFQPHHALETRNIKSGRPWRIATRRSMGARP